MKNSKKKVYCKDCKWMETGIMLYYCIEPHKGIEHTPLTTYRCSSDDIEIKNKNNDCLWFEEKK